MFYDEYEHLDIADNLAAGFALAESLADGPGVTVMSPTLWPGAQHMAIAGLIKLGLPAERAGFLLNAALGAATAPLLVLLGAAAFKDEKAGIAAAGLWALFPLHVRYSASVDMMVGSCFWLALALTLLFWHEEKPEPRLAALLAATLAIAGNWRVENVLLCLMAGAYIGRGSNHGFARYIPGIVLLLMPIPLVIWVNHSSQIPGFGEIGNLAANVLGSLKFIVAPENHALGLVLLGLWAILRERSRRTDLLIGLSAGFFLFYSCYHIGDFSKESSERYALAVLLPLCALAGRVVAHPPHKFAVAALLIWTLVPYPAAPGVPQRFSENDAFLRRTVARASPASFVIAFSPSAVKSAAGLPAVSPYLVLGDEAWLERLGPEPMLLRDYWSDKRPEDAARIERLLETRYNLVPVASGECVTSCELLALRPKR